MELEGKRAETRMKRRVLNRSMGIKGDRRVSAEVVTRDVLAEVANQTRGGE
jgi:hypothetical protein